MRVLQLTAHFSPNIGGVETHLDDLVRALSKRKYEVFVLTYRPLTAKVNWKIFEKRETAEILRIPWIPGLFYQLVGRPVYEFIYLLPGLFFLLPFVIIFKDPDVIHAHGLVAGFVAVFWGKMFGKGVVISTHNIYHFPASGVYRRFVKWIFTNGDFVMGLSKKETKEIASLGIPKNKVGSFTYWIDLEKFIPVPKKQAKVKLGWDEKFVVLFVGRLVPEKGVRPLLKAAGTWSSDIYLALVGTGPLEGEVRAFSSKHKNIFFLGKIRNTNLPIYYSGSDLTIIPSVHDEGFGRVILESLACGTPVIGSNRGAIPEAMDQSVGKLIDVSPENIRKSIELFYVNSAKLGKLSKKARKFAVLRYSETNVEQIIEAYRKAP
jgi:glycosyltransferase involved in cell wall biosynthesis